MSRSRHDGETRSRSPRARRTRRQSFKFHLISGLQQGADRGALLGLDDVRKHAANADIKTRLTTGGFAPLGFKCDDYIQPSAVDTSPEAAASIEKEKKWLHGPVNREVRGLIKRFRVQELPNDKHKIKFKEKDLKNVDQCDVVVCFRAPVPASGAGSEQTVNYALFGEYTFVEQFRNGELAGGALQRAELLQTTGWPTAYKKQMHDGGAIVRKGTLQQQLRYVEFKKGQSYHVLRTFPHHTERDDEASARKGKECFKAMALKQPTLLEREWSAQPAARSAVVFTLSHVGENSEVADDLIHRKLTHFLLTAASKTSGPLRVMVTGPTEHVFAGTQERVRSIFKTAIRAVFNINQNGKTSTINGRTTKKPNTRKPRRARGSGGHTRHAERAKTCLKKR